MANADPTWDENVRGKKMSNTEGMTIYKYPITSQRMSLPRDMEIIRVEEEDDRFWFWAKIDTKGPRSLAKIRMIQMPILEEYELLLPVGAQIITVSEIGGKFYLWYIQRLPENRPLQRPAKERRKFRAFKTGGTMPSGLKMNYLGLCKLHVQMELALYIFEDLT